MENVKRPVDYTMKLVDSWYHIYSVYDTGEVTFLCRVQSKSTAEALLRTYKAGLNV